MDGRWSIVLIGLVLVCGCVGKTATNSSTTIPDNGYCDAQKPCDAGECYLFQNMPSPICYDGDPCASCQSGKCRVSESYPPQVFCEEENTTNACDTKVLQCDRLPIKVDRLVCFILKAKVDENETLCEQITDPEYQKVCYQIIRAQKHGPSSCDSIPDMYWRHMCYEWLAGSQDKSK